MASTVLDYKVLGATLKQGRVNAGYSQKDVAEWFGITYQNVSSWERGASKVDIDSLLILCERYGLNFVDVVSAASEKKPPVVSDEGPTAKFASLFNQLGSEQQALVISAMQGMKQDK